MVGAAACGCHIRLLFGIIIAEDGAEGTTCPDLRRLCDLSDAITIENLSPEVCPAERLRVLTLNQER